MTAKDNTNFLTTREAAKQLGISLSTVQGWVENGALRAWKTPGGHRRIPVEEVETIRQRQLEILQPHKPLAHLSVLIVEDEAAQQEIYRLQFEQLNLPVDLHIADNGYQGLIMFGRHEPDLIFADLAMPEMDGFRMIHELIVLGIHSDSIIVVTGLSDAEIIKSGGIPKGITLLAKPVQLQVLENLLFTKIGMSRLSM